MSNSRLASATGASYHSWTRRTSNPVLARLSSCFTVSTSKSILSAAATLWTVPPYLTVSGLYRTNTTDLPPIAPTISLIRAHSHDSSYPRAPRGSRWERARSLPRRGARRAPTRPWHKKCPRSLGTRRAPNGTFFVFLLFAFCFLLFALPFAFCFSGWVWALAKPRPFSFGV
jgi:hypothetical protein